MRPPLGFPHASQLDACLVVMNIRARLLALLGHSHRIGVG
jgi:hypothetical protein